MQSYKEGETFLGLSPSLVSVGKHKNQSNWSSPGPLDPRKFQEVYNDLIKANGLGSNKSFRA